MELGLAGVRLMARHRIHSLSFKKQIVQEYAAGATLNGLAREHDLSRNLIRIWVAKSESGEFDPDVEAATLLADYDRAGADGRPSGARDRAFKGGSAARTVSEKRAYVRDRRPGGLSVSQGCRLMGIARSTYYGAPAADR